jgi:hypothetical protein
MTKEIKRRRGTTVEHNTFTGAEGEITIDSDINVAVIHDGVVPGGYPLAKADMSNADLSDKINVNELATSDGASGDILTTDGSGQIVFALPGGITGNSVGVVELDTSDGLAGTVLTTNGAGTISFSPVSVGVDELELIDGTDGQVLTTNGNGTISFQTITGSMINISGNTQGDVMYYDGTDWIVLAAGTAGQVLTMNSGATAPEWV